MYIIPNDANGLHLPHNIHHIIIMTRRLHNDSKIVPFQTVNMYQTAIDEATVFGDIRGPLAILFPLFFLFLKTGSQFMRVHVYNFCLDLIFPYGIF